MSDKNIVLIGLSGCGKTTLGELLSQKLHKEFYDSDMWVEEKTGRTISDMFAEGEDVFRANETEALEELSQKHGVILATGGGAVKNPHNIEVLQKNGTIVYINRPPKMIVESAAALENRPLLANDTNKIFKLYEERKSLYENASDISVPNVGGIDECIDMIINSFSDIAVAI